MFTRAIVCPPSANFSQGLTTSDLGQPDYEAALAQHHAYCVALEDCGLTLFKLSADPAYPDSTFVEDTAVLIEPAGGNPAEYQAVITTPGALSRRGETSAIRQTLLNFFPSLHEIHAPGTLDGGDICQAGWHFFIGISERTNEAGAQQLVEHLARMDYSASLIDIRNTPELLHLKSGIAYLGDSCLVVVEAIAGHAAFTEYDRISIEADEMYAANCIRINDHVLIAAGYPKFEQALAERGHHTVALKMSEFQKMDGGLSCLSLRF